MLNDRGNIITGRRAEGMTAKYFERHSDSVVLVLFLVHFQMALPYQIQKLEFK